MRKKKQPMSQEMSCCPPSASSIEAEATANFNQEKENSLAGDMKDEEKVSTEKTDFQASHGRLDTTESEEHCPHETLDERFEELDVEAIQPFGLIPNYVIPSDLKYPVVAKTPLNYFCLDGWNLIEGAKANGKITLKCFIEEIEEHSNEELAIRKVSLREKPRGGISSYAETIRNAYEHYSLLSKGNLKYRIAFDQSLNSPGFATIHIHNEEMLQWVNPPRERP